MGVALVSLRAPRRGGAFVCALLLGLCLSSLAPSTAASATHVVRRGETLGAIAQRYGVRLSTLRQANGLRGDRILAGQRLTVPDESRRTWTVRRGESLSLIAARTGVPVSRLKRLNGLRGDEIRVGQVLRLRPRTRPSSTTARSPAPATADAIHVVRRGDTLLRIARRAGVPLSTLRKINGLEGDRIYPGQKIRLREAASSVHIVERGDALWEIAQAYGLSVRELKKINGLTSDRILPGQELRVRAPRDAAPPRYGEYRVRPGDSLGEIAQMHQMSLSELRSLNGLRGSLIHPGQRLRVRPILGTGGHLGLLTTEAIDWDQLVPPQPEVPVIEASNGPYYFSRPRATSQASPAYYEGSTSGPWKTYRQAKRLFDAFAARVDRMGRLSHRLDGWTIVLDPGHGGVDPGTIVATEDGHGREVYVVEDEYVYDIALRMYVLLTLHGADVHLTLLSPNHLLRASEPAADTYVHERNEVFNSESLNRRNAASSWPRGGSTGLARRREIAADAFAGAPAGRRLFLSLHADNSPNSPEGVTVFYERRSHRIDRASRRFAQHLLPALGAGARAKPRNLGVLRGNPADAKVLVEIRNLSYPSQAWALRFEKLRHRDAEKLVKGILDHVGQAALARH